MEQTKHITEYLLTLWLADKFIATLAKQHAENEFEKYRPIQDRIFESDFDKVMKMIENKEK